MNDDNVITFPDKPEESKASLDRKGLWREKVRVTDIEVIGILTAQDIDYYIEDRADIEKVMRFIHDSNIVVRRTT